ncbi:MAG TPA: L,D-transpeptidase family protein [Phycisphaerales bacterium]|nr:L,D-transpeptidase family protein [Phycisphaerales bacterium]
MNARRVLIVSTTVLAVTLAVAAVPAARTRAWGIYTRLRGRQTVDSVLASVGPAARARLPGMNPADTITLVAFKREKRLDVFAGAEGETPRLLKSYPILAASGGPGPKTREGDNQVPEGVYSVTSLNPNSAFHLALRLDYPNDDDLAAAKAEGRDLATLGGDIMIHGKAASIGCLAMGDAAVEELFVLAADIGPGRLRVLILPHDPRSAPLTDPRPWVAARYARLLNLLPEQ